MTARKRKLLLVVTKPNWGGAQRYVFDLASSIAGDRFEVAVVIGSRSGTTDASSDRLAVRLRASGVRVIDVPALRRDMDARDDCRAFVALYRVFERERPDLVHLNSSKAAGIGALAARLAGVPRVVYSVHGWPFSEPRPRVQRALIRAASWLSALLAHRVIVVSELDRVAAKDWPLVGARVRRVPCSIGPAAALPAAEAREKLTQAALRFGDTAPPIDATWIGSVAELHPNKGLAHAVEAFAGLADRVPTAQLLLVGEGEQASALRAQIDARGLRSRVHLCGFVEDAAQLLPAFDVFLLPSLKEGLPYVLLEAAAVGLPIVASRVGGVPDLFRHRGNGLLVQPGHSQQILDALVELLESPRLRTTLGAAARADLKDRFDLDSMLTATLRIYDDDGLVTR